MPKMKTKKSAAKRFKKTGTGKLLYRGQGQKHLASKKNRQRKRRLSRGKQLTGTDKKIVERLRAGH